MSDTPLFSEHWFRVRDLTPRLASDVEVRRHVYRKKVHYVLHRKSTSSFFRIEGSTFELVGKLDGSISVGDLWELSIEQQDSKAPSQPEFIQLLADLHEAELLIVNRRINAEQLFARGAKQVRNENRKRYLNPLFLRFKLFDPDKLLTIVSPAFGFLFNRIALFAWFLLILFALFQLAPEWTALQGELAGFGYISPKYAVIFIIVYPLLKILHELAHGITLKRFGAEVHEFGIAMMVLLPIPYVDASAAAALPDKRQRIIVSAAGIILELSVAAIATVIWVVSNGIVHDIALVIMLTGGISTLLFNGNPLLKFDGYYILADAIEIPNLAERSTKCVQRVASHILIGKELSSETINTTEERLWLIGYGVFSVLYRLVLMLTIAYILSNQYFFFGLLLAAWIIVTLVVKPCGKFLSFIVKNSSLENPRAVFITSAGLSSLVAALVLAPIPLNTVAEGIVWLPDRSIVRVANSCEITQQNTQDGQDVSVGDILFICEDPNLPLKIAQLKAELSELEAQQKGQILTKRVSHTLLNHKIDTAKKKIEEAISFQTDRIVRAQIAGKFVVANKYAIQNSYFEQGEIAAYVIPADDRTIQVPIVEHGISQITNNVDRVHLRFTEQLTSNSSYQSKIIRQTPKATLEVSSAALTTAGGGSLLADPDGNGRMLTEPVFNLELAWPENAPRLHVGSRVWVKFEHGNSPILIHLIVKAQRAFLGRLEV